MADLVLDAIPLELRGTAVRAVAGTACHQIHCGD